MSGCEPGGKGELVGGRYAGGIKGRGGSAPRDEEGYAVNGEHGGIGVESDDLVLKVQGKEQRA